MNADQLGVPHGFHHRLWILQWHSFVQSLVDKLSPLHHVLLEPEAFDGRARLNLFSALQLCCAPDLLKILMLSNAWNRYLSV